jgi:hypothetical protein
LNVVLAAVHSAKVLTRVFSAAVPTSVAIVTPPMMKAIVLVAIEIMAPIPAALIVVRTVVRWPIGEWSNHSNAWQAKSDADVGVSLGRNALSHACEPESRSQGNGCKSMHGLYLQIDDTYKSGNATLRGALTLTGRELID